MPDVITPVQLQWSGVGLIESPAVDFVNPARLYWSGGTLADGDQSGVTTLVTTPELDRLTRFDDLIEGGNPTVRFMGIWQEAMEKIEEAFQGLTGQVTDLTSIVNRLAAAETLAQAAKDESASTTSKQDLADSYTNPTSVSTYSNNGTVNIVAHSRVYPISGTSVAVNSGSVSGFAEGDYVTVYYNDVGREGGAVTYIGTTNAVAQTDGRHIVAQGRIPAAGNPPSGGTSPSGPGYTPIQPEGGGTGGTEYQ